MNQNNNTNRINEDSREINSMRNVIANVIYLIITFAGNFITKQAIVKMLGFEYYGVQGLFSNIFLLITFAEIGIASAMSFSLYKPLAQKDYAKIDALYFFFRKIYYFLVLFTLTLGVIGFLLLNDITNTSIPYNKLLTYYIIYMLQAIISSLFAYKARILVADQKRYVFTLITTIGDGLSLALGAVVLYTGYGFEVFLSIVVIKNIGVSFFVHRSVKKRYPFLQNKESIDIKETKKVISNVRDLFIYNLSDSILTTTDSIFISILLSTIYVGLYSSYQWIVKAISSIVFNIFKAISASVGNLLLDNNSDNKYRIFMTTQIVNMWLCGMTTVCFFYLVQDFIVLWIGADATLPMSIVWIITISMYFTSIRQSILVFREAAGMFKKARNVVIIKAVLNVVLSLSFGILWGIFGIVLATLISTLATTYWYEPYILNKKYFKVSMKKDIIMQIEGIIYFVICLWITGMISNLLPISGWISIFIKTIILLIVTNVFYIGILSFHREAFSDLISIVKSFFNYTKAKTNK